jgi:hypothetical protein
MYMIKNELNFSQIQHIFLVKLFNSIILVKLTTYLVGTVATSKDG